MSLAAVRRPEEVPAAVTGALAIIVLRGETPAEAVERFLATKHLLLVADNCEHLPGAAPFIARLAAAAPGVTVLATSREPLAVQAEHVHAVAPLALPQPAASDLEALAAVPAVALFCERARAHDRAFALDDANGAAVAEICARLDGLPLAIELAAARCGLLSPGEIAVRLRDTLAALGTGPRDAPARQRTLRATIDWSHDLLDDDERACFARFAVFAGGATVEAAEAVTAADLDTLDRLVAKSLLVRQRQPGGAGRLHMLETIRAYATERFAARPDAHTVRAAPLRVLPRPRAPPRERPGALRPPAAPSTSRGSTPTARTCAPRSTGHSGRTSPVGSWRWPWRSSSTGGTATATPTRSAGASGR